MFVRFNAFFGAVLILFLAGCAAPIPTENEMQMWYTGSTSLKELERLLKKSQVSNKPGDPGAFPRYYQPKEYECDYNHGEHSKNIWKICYDYKNEINSWGFKRSGRKITYENFKSGRSSKNEAYSDVFRCGKPSFESTSWYEVGCNSTLRFHFTPDKKKEAVQAYWILYNLEQERKKY